MIQGWLYVLAAICGVGLVVLAIGEGPELWGRWREHRNEPRRVASSGSARHRAP